MSEKSKIIGVPIDHYVGDTIDHNIDDPEFSLLDEACKLENLGLCCISVNAMRDYLLKRMKELTREDEEEGKKIKFELLKSVVEEGLEAFPKDFVITDEDPDLQEAGDRIWAAKAKVLAIEIAKQDVACEDCSAENCDLRRRKTEDQEEHREDI